MDWRILSIGADSEAHRSLQELVQSQSLLKFQHQEMGSTALEHLLNLPESLLAYYALPVLPVQQQAQLLLTFGLLTLDPR